MRSNSDEVERKDDCYAIYTSPPPTGEPLLKEKPFGIAFDGLNLWALLKMLIKSADKLLNFFVPDLTKS